MAKFVTIGERLSTTAPAVNKAFTERDPEPILSLIHISEPTRRVDGSRMPSSA